MPITKETLTTKPDGTQIHKVVKTTPEEAEVLTTAEVVVEAPVKPLSDIPDLQGIVVIGAMGALSAYATTWFMRGVCNVNGGAWHWKLRLTALLSGSLAGFLLGGWPWGAIVGLGGGALTTVIVAAIKKRIKKTVG
tara:strand:+ start:446 stop:853 length:408 start_codon:yes stop_codon:yes gene_type:complete